ncbi:MAG: minor capsid protein [Gordonibacter sp.]
MPLQIPLSELTDSLEVRIPNPQAEYGGEYLDAVTIEYVRFERKEALNPRIYKLADGAQGRLWIDAVNSAGAFEVPKGSKVSVPGKAKNMQVIVCVPHELRGRVHHWEVDVK